MKKIFCVVFIALVASAFVLPANDPFATNVLRNLLLRIKNQPQEKVYLQNDREHYAAGEKIWFRAYLADAVTHKPSEHSRYIYVELVDKLDSVRQRVKIVGVDSVYSGHIPLSKKLEQGEYFLRAYSYWMQNAGEDFIFKKKIRIVNVQDSKVITNLKYVKGKEGDVVEIQFMNSRKNIYDKVFIDYVIDKKLRIQRTNENGIIRLTSKELGKSRNVQVKFKESLPFNFERDLYIPERNKDFDVQFFPEGGNLIAGKAQTVAFKAIGADGFGKEVEGYLYNERDEFVAPIKSVNKGMGGFDLKPEAGHRYHAIVMSADSVQKRIDFPLPETDKIALKVSVKDSILNYSVLVGDSVQIPDNLYLGVLSRGIPLICAPLTRSIGKLSLKVFPEGIIQLVLMNSKYEIYSQRLCFVRKKNRPELSVESDKKSYVIRDLARMNVNVTAQTGQELSGSFSVAVTDDVQCERDSTSQNHILSYLLLTSDLKGYVEDPAFYFRNANRFTDQMVDLLMLTQGWTRFDLPTAIRGELPESAYYLEKGQAISGKVKNFWGKDALNANLVVFTTSGIIRMATADSSGYFIVDGIAFPDSTQFVVQAQSKKGRRTVELIVEQDLFMKPSVKIPYGLESIEKEGDFYKKFVKDYYYDNGIKVYVLDEAIIQRRMAPKVYSMYDYAATQALDSVKIASMLTMNMNQVLEEIHGIRVDESEQKVYWGSKPLALFVNDLPEDYNYVMTLRPADLLHISYLDASQAGVLFGEGASSGAIVITTNPHFVGHTKPTLNIAVTSLLGYQKKANFYTPRYDVDSVRRALAKVTDERSTIYWNPNVRTDKSGKAEFSFYMSDSYGPYTLIIEGILNDGTVCRKEQKVTLKLR